MYWNGYVYGAVVKFEQAVNALYLQELHRGAAAAKAELVDDVHIPAKARQALERLRRERARLELEERKARAATESVVRLLTRKLGLSVRDVGELLGLSYQRVHQIAHGGSR